MGKTLYENSSDDEEIGVMFISGHGTALSVWEYDGDWQSCGYGYAWDNVSSGTVFDAQKIKTLSDVNRMYGTSIDSGEERVRKSAIRAVPVKKTVKTYVKIEEVEP